MITEINGQYKIEIETEKVILLCDETFYYNEPQIIPAGITWSGRPCILFDTIQEAQDYITNNNLTLYVEEL